MICFYFFNIYLFIIHHHCSHNTILLFSHWTDCSFHVTSDYLSDLRTVQQFNNLLFCPEHQNLQQRYEKRERECEAKNKEKEEMMVMLNTMKDRLEKECNEHKQAKMHMAELSAQLQQMVSSSANMWSPEVFCHQSTWSEWLCSFVRRPVFQEDLLWHPV